jgi:hypothetical protein
LSFNFLREEENMEQKPEEKFMPPHPEIPFRSFLLSTVYFWFVFGLSVGITWALAPAWWIIIYMILLAYVLTLGRICSCCRCDRYGKECGIGGLGYISSFYLPREEGKPVNLVLGLLDMVSFIVIVFSPLFLVGGRTLLFIVYLVIGVLFFLFIMRVGCWRCPVENCPLQMLSRLLYGKPPEEAEEAETPAGEEPPAEQESEEAPAEQEKEE